MNERMHRILLLIQELNRILINLPAEYTEAIIITCGIFKINVKSHFIFIYAGSNYLVNAVKCTATINKIFFVLIL